MVKRFSSPRSKQLLDKGGPGYGPKYNFQEYDSWDVVYWFDDFLGTELQNAPVAGATGAYSVRTGVDGDLDILADQTNGVAELRASNAAGADDEFGMAFLNNLNFRGDHAAGMAVRVAVDTFSTVRVELGFTDSEGDDMIIKNGDLNTIGDEADNGMNATDAVFWAFDTDETSDNWHHAGVKNGTETVVVDSNILPVAGTFETLGIQLVDDMAEFFRLDANGNETYRTQTGSSITAATKILPFIGIQLKTGSIDRNLHVDYWASWQRRTTSTSVVTIG